jgi:hypothetical protein
MKSIQTLELPESEQDLVYLQLLHQGQYYEHIVDRVKNWMIDSVLSNRESPWTENFVTWLTTQRVIDIHIMASPNHGVSIVFGLREAVLNVGHQAFVWYAQIDHLVDYFRGDA